MRLTVKDHERALGFKWSGRGRMRTATSTPLPLVDICIDRLTDVFADSPMRGKDLVASSEVLMSIDAHFTRIGAELWPDEGAPRRAWLVDAGEETYDGLYTRNLYYSSPEDQGLLRENFRDLVLTRLGKRLYDLRRKRPTNKRADLAAMNESASTKPEPSTSVSRPNIEWHVLTAFQQPDSCTSGKLSFRAVAAIAAAIVGKRATYKWRGTTFSVPEDMKTEGNAVIERLLMSSNDQTNEIQPAASPARRGVVVIDLTSDSDEDEESAPEEQPTSSTDHSTQCDRVMLSSVEELDPVLASINLEVRYSIRQREFPVVNLRECYTSANLFERVQSSIPGDTQIGKIQVLIIHLPGEREVRLRQDHEPDFQRAVQVMIVEAVHRAFVVIEL